MERAIGMGWVKKPIAKAGRGLRDALREENEQIAEKLKGLRDDFLRRDAERYPGGWKLPTKGDTRTP